MTSEATAPDPDPLPDPVPGEDHPEEQPVVPRGPTEEEFAAERTADHRWEKWLIPKELFALAVVVVVVIVRQLWLT